MLRFSGLISNRKSCGNELKSNSHLPTRTHCKRFPFEVFSAGSKPGRRSKRSYSLPTLNTMSKPLKQINCEELKKIELFGPKLIKKNEERLIQNRKIEILPPILDSKTLSKMVPIFISPKIESYTGNQLMNNIKVKKLKETEYFSSEINLANKLKEAGIHSKVNLREIRINPKQKTSIADLMMKYNKKVQVKNKETENNCKIDVTFGNNDSKEV